MVNLLIVGYDNPEARDHIFKTQTFRTVVLTYAPKKKGNRKWYVGRPGCTPPRPVGHDCDEYPFFKTKEGGPLNFRRGVEIAWVPSGQNKSVGGHFGFLAKTMKKPKNREFAVVTSSSLPTVALPIGK